MSMKRIVIVGIAILLIALVGWLVLYLLTAKNPTPNEPVDDPFGGIVATSTVTPRTGDIIIRNARGVPITVPDFTKGRTPLESDSDTYYDLVHEGPLFGDEDYTFGVQYQSSNSYFLVSLLKEPLRTSRAEAETFLRNLLVLSNEQLCKLNLSVIVTTDVNAIYADKGNLGLSFCPGAIPLP